MDQGTSRRGQGGILLYLESDFYRAVAEATLSGRETEKPVKTTGADPALIRLAAASLLYDQAWRELKDAHRGPFSMVAHWSLAVREAEMLLRKDKLGRRVTAEAHLERMKDLEKMAIVLNEEFSKTTFFRADAEVFLTELIGTGGGAEERRADAARLRLDSAKEVYQGTWDDFQERRTNSEFVYEWSAHWQMRLSQSRKTKPTEFLRARRI